MTSRLFWHQRGKERTNASLSKLVSTPSDHAKPVGQSAPCRPARRKYVVTSDTSGPKKKTVITIRSYHTPDSARALTVSNKKPDHDLIVNAAIDPRQTPTSPKSVAKTHEPSQTASLDLSNHKDETPSTYNSLPCELLRIDSTNVVTHNEDYPATNSDEASIYEDAVEYFDLGTPGSPTSTLFDRSYSQPATLDAPWSPLLDLKSINSAETLVDDGLSPWGLPKALDSHSDDEDDVDSEMEIARSQVPIQSSVHPASLLDYSSLLRKYQQAKFIANIVDSYRKRQRLKQQELRLAAASQLFTTTQASTSLFSRLTSWI